MPPILNSLNIEIVSIAALLPDPANVRTHDPRNIDALAASLRRFGQQKPIVVDQNNIVRAGNGTLEAARRLGWTELAVVRTALSAADAVAFAIADNRTAELAAWDVDALTAQMGALDEELRLAAGFTDAELSALVAGNQEGADGESDAADLAEKAVDESYQVVVTCRDEPDQRAVFDRMEREGRSCKILTM